MPLGSGINPFLQSAGGIAPYGMRYGGDVPLNMNPTPKGLGYFGPLQNSYGGVSTEISADNAPLLVPTLNVSELQLLLSGGMPTQDIYRKAADYAKGREASGLSPYFGSGELRFPAPVEQHPTVTLRNLINGSMPTNTGPRSVLNQMPAGVRG